ncbi:MAG: DNA mismatch repair protein MutS [Acidobacteria bacterium]|nr:DNA mismatch repair protein MutS [Acidobacteriota bacterium]
MENSSTPMLRQYHEIKKQYPGTLLFFRLGDFYELFNEDAVTGARELEITLTARHKESKNPVPMCGVPHHAAAGYISRLVKKGYRVAICEQTEEAGKTVKLVKREVVRVITPGTAIDPQIVEAKESVYLASVCGAGVCFGAAFLELSTGEFLTTQFSGAEAWTKICADIESFAPRELLFPESLQKLVADVFKGNQNYQPPDAPNIVSISPPNSMKFSPALTPLDDWLFHADDCAQLLEKQLKARELSGFGLDGKVEAVRAAGACLRYAQETQRVAAEHVADLNFFEANDCLVLDAVTLKNLEIVEARGENRNRTLFDVLNQTITGMGARILRSWLLRPSLKKSEIQTRLSAVGELTDLMLRDKIRFLLKDVSDLERLVGRLNLGTATPRDLVALNRSLSQTPHINQSLSDASSLLLQVLSENVFELPEIRELIGKSIVDEPPPSVGDGLTIRNGFNEKLDELRKISTDAKRIVAAFEEQEKKRTGISNLKIKFNNVFGYFIEISKGQLTRVPADYERRQTLTNAERFSTAQLREWEQKILGADDKIRELEAEIFRQVRRRVTAETKSLQSTARALATLDALAGLAETAARRNYVAPVLHDGDEIEIEDGRHPIVEAFSNGDFIPNDLRMNNSTDRLLIITGPNMGGKSTILRQAALIQIMAQTGSFVPAKSARLPIVDRVWTRVGASDDLAGGRSTFMVEMTETAAILHNATPRSLILLDEIGRGTSTFDGLSIAWAVAEYIHNSPQHSAKTLFATHYHELTELAENLSGAQNYQVLASERDGAVVFLHKLQKGKASKSYGIAVAQLAGLPAQTIARAGEVLNKLEQYELAVFSENEKLSENEKSAAASASIVSADSATDAALKDASKSKRATQFSLFAIANDFVIEELRARNLENLSGEEAKLFLAELKSRIV